MNKALLSLVARANVERIHGKVTPTPNLPRPFVLEDTEPEPDALDLSVSDATGPLLIPGEDRKVSVADVVKVMRDAGGRIEGQGALIGSLRLATGSGERMARVAITEAENRKQIWSVKNAEDKRGRIYVLKGGMDE